MFHRPVLELAHKDCMLKWAGTKIPKEKKCL